MGKPSHVIDDISNIVLKIVVFALVIGSILGSTAFAAITIINVTLLSETYGLAIIAFTGFLVIGATIAAIVWFFKYVRDLFDKKTGMSSITA